MDKHSEMGTTIAKKGHLAGGYARGSEIFLPSTDGSGTVFMKMFHEIGHIIDNQFDLKKSIRPISEIKTAIIPFSTAERTWLLEQSGLDWPESGVTNVHLDILQKILAVILEDGVRPEYNIHSVSREEVEEKIHEGGVGASVIEDGQLVIVDHKQHRNLEFPADYILELCFDIINRSINKEFALPASQRIFEYIPDERNQRTDTIARYVLKKGWIAPGYIFNKMMKE